MAEFMAIDEAAFRQTATGGNGPRAISARFDRRRCKLVLRLETGLDLAFDPKRLPGLEAATDDELTDIEIEGIGSTLHFPRLDADFGIARLLELFLGSKPPGQQDAHLRSRRAPGKSAA